MTTNTNLLNTTTNTARPEHNVIVLGNEALIGRDLRVALTNYCNLWKDRAREIQATGEISEDLAYGLEYTLWIIEQMVPGGELHVLDGFLSWKGGYIYCSIGLPF